MLPLQLPPSPFGGSNLKFTNSHIPSPLLSFFFYYKVSAYDLSTLVFFFFFLVGKSSRHTFNLAFSKIRGCRKHKTVRTQRTCKIFLEKLRRVHMSR